MGNRDVEVSGVRFERVFSADDHTFIHPKKKTVTTKKEPLQT